MDSPFYDILQPDYYAAKIDGLNSGDALVVNTPIFAEHERAIKYSFSNGSQTNGFFTINATTGVITLNSNITSTNAAAAYTLTIKAYEVANPGRYDMATVKVENTWSVRLIEWQKHEDGNDLISTWTGLSVYADSDTPNPANDNYRKVELLVGILGFVPSTGGVVTLAKVDPPNASIPGAASIDNYTDTFNFVGGTTLKFMPGELIKTKTVLVDQNAGNNYLVDATGGTTPNTVTTSDILTVWRRFWLELDQMAMPNPLKQNPYGAYVDGFHPSLEYNGTFTKPDGSLIFGLWARPGTTLHAPEPRDFDILFQPPKPDPSILISAMQDACVNVIVVDESQFREWYPQSTPFREEMPFKHNMENPALSANALTEMRNIGNQSRDLPVTHLGFMCGLAIGAYEPHKDESGDTYEEWIFGVANAGYDGGYNVFMIFQESIRDAISTKSNYIRTESEMNQLVTFHEFLHWYGFIDEGKPGYSPQAHGLIMGKGWLTSDTIDAYIKLTPDQIKEIQKYS